MGEGLDRSLRTSHRTLLAMIALCAVLSALQSGDGDDLPPDPIITTVAVALGLGTVVARRTSTSAVISSPTRVFLLLCAYACALILAVVGAFVAMTRGQSQIGLMFVLAAGIFSLRPPPTFDSSGPRTT